MGLFHQHPDSQTISVVHYSPSRSMASHSPVTCRVRGPVQTVPEWSAILHTHLSVLFLVLCADMMDGLQYEHTRPTPRSGLEGGSQVNVCLYQGRSLHINVWDGASKVR